MHSHVDDLTETDADILNFDVPDDALERAAGGSEGRAITWGFCTHNWMNCGWPL